MTLLLVFALVLLLGVLISGLANRSVLSTAVLFLTAGLVLGEGSLGVLELVRATARSASWPSWPSSQCCSPTASGSASATSGRPGGCPEGPWCWGCRSPS